MWFDCFTVCKKSLKIHLDISDLHMSCLVISTQILHNICKTKGEAIPEVWAVEANASNLTFGAILSQSRVLGTTTPICFLLSKITSAKVNYDIWDKELFTTKEASTVWVILREPDT